jgi:hypothetical protein
MQRLRTFLNKARGKAIDIDDFPFLLSLQIYCGASGIIFSLAWFAVVGLSYPDFWNKYTLPIAFAFVVGFLAMILVGTNAMQKVGDRSLNPARDWDFYARMQMLALVVMFALLCCGLIWFTGGMSSPFSPFYVMVYTLILTRCALPHPGQALLILYGVTYIAAGVLATKFAPPLVSYQTLSEINRGYEREVTEFLFVLAAMAVPYFSTLWAERREAQRRGEAVPPPAAAEPR